MAMQPVNYAADALAGFKGVQDIFSQRADDERRKEDSAMRRESHGLNMEKGRLDLDEAQSKADDRLRFDIMSQITNINGLEETNTPEEAAAAKQRVAAIGGGLEGLQSQLSIWKNPGRPEGNLSSQAPVGTVNGVAIPAVPGGADNASMAPQQVPGEAIVQNGKRYWKQNFKDNPEFQTLKTEAKRLAPDIFTREHLDPVTKRKYRSTDFGDEVMLSEDGQILFTLQTSYSDTGEPYKVVPRTTKGTNSPDDPLAFKSMDEIKKKLAFFHNVYDRAEKTGRPALEVGREMAAQIGIDNLPREERIALAKDRALGQGRTTEHLAQKEGELAISDKRAVGVNAKTAAEIKELQPQLDAILADKGKSQQEKRGAIATLVAGTSPETQARLTGSRAMASSIVPDRDKVTQVTKYEEGAGGGRVRDVVELSDGRIIKGEPYQKHASKGSGNNLDVKVLQADILKSSTMYAAKAKAFNKYANEIWATTPDENKKELEKQLLLEKAELDAEKAAVEVKAEEFFTLTGKKYLPGGVNGEQAPAAKPGAMAATVGGTQVVKKGAKYTAESLPLGDPRVQKAFQAGYTPEQVAAHLNK